MIECPKCQQENNDGAKFCTRCGARLDEPQARPTRRLEDLPAPTVPVKNLETDPARHGTKPLPQPAALEPRPNHAIFGDRFLSTGLLYSDNQSSAAYQVEEIGSSAKLLLRQCPACGAVHSRWEEGAEPDRFCSSCGTQMESSKVLLQLFESADPLPDSVVQIARMGLVHSNVRAPVAAFSEILAGVNRYCLVTPPADPVPHSLEQNQAIRWTAGLARALDYLYRNQVSFNGQADAASIGFSSNRLVWTNFRNAVILENDNLEQGRINDLKGLVNLLHQWLTGKTTTDADPDLPAPLKRLVEKAFGPEGFRSGRELASALETIVNDSLSALPIDYNIGKRTHTGIVRDLNEDAMYAIETARVVQSHPQPLGIFVVADGMGGHSAGEVASGTIISYFAQRAPQDLATIQAQTGGMNWSDWLKETVNGANKAVYDLRTAAGTDMGSTLVMAVMDGLKAYLANVGDSRAYLVNNQGIQRITTDHSLVERLIATGQIRRQEGRTHPQRNVVYRTIGDKEKVDVDVFTLTLEPGDKILLCSDGLWEMLEDETALQIIRESSNPQAACEKLVAAANTAGGEDNITAILVEAVRAD